MSNWSSVILCWSGVDYAAEDDTGHRTRLEDIAHKCRDDKSMVGLRMGEGWVYVPPCPEEEAPGSACEVVAVNHINYFGVLDLMKVLDTFRWNSPEEVEVLWKGEEADRYQAMTLEEYRLKREKDLL